MKKLLILLIVCLLSVPSYAQFKMPRSTKGHSHVGKSAKRSKVSASSRRVNAAFRRQMRKISLTSAFPTTALKREHTKQGRIYRSTFQLHQTDGPLAPAASGFAIDLLGDGTVKGVTAGHLMRDISKRNRTPHIRVQTGPDSFIIIPIDKKSIVFGNPEGIDIALFDIPKKALPYVTILHPAEHVPTVGEEVTFRGHLEYQNAHPFTLSNQKVLLSTPLRIFIERNPEEANLRGFCGSPGFVNGLVSMVIVFVGPQKDQELPEYGWFNKKNLAPIATMHHAIPIDVVKRIAKSVKETGSADQGGIMMKVLDYPVALMRPDQAIVSIEQFRNGERVAKIDRDFPINPKQLSLFLDLEEDDILRITLDSFSIERPKPVVDTIYEVNVSTGEVTEVSKEARP